MQPWPLPTDWSIAEWGRRPRGVDIKFSDIQNDLAWRYEVSEPGTVGQILSYLAQARYCRIWLRPDTVGQILSYLAQARYCRPDTVVSGSGSSFLDLSCLTKNLSSHPKQLMGVSETPIVPANGVVYVQLTPYIVSQSPLKSVRNKAPLSVRYRYRHRRH